LANHKRRFFARVSASMSEFELLITDIPDPTFQT
jgi:hypothetical protein